MKWFSGLLLVLFHMTAFAGDIEWNGVYRFEGLMMSNPEARKNNEESKAYMLHHLVLRPKITAYDGLTINGRFDILNAGPQYADMQNSQTGDFLGGGVGAAPSQNSGNSNVISENQKSSFINVNELYLTYAHEFGILTVGRAPIHFGLGMSYNNGSGDFDHWFDNRDMVAYKFVTGNLFFMPVIAKLSESTLATADDVDDYMMQVQYENPDSELTIGILYRRRHAGSTGNDLPISLVGANPQSSFKGEYWNLFFSRWIGESIKIGLEASMQSGKTGAAVGGSEVEMDGLGVALEVDYIPKGSNFNMGLKAGTASGDDPGTTNSYEGFMFDRNYDIAMLMFNHPMGQYDIFRTGYVRNTSTAAAGTVGAASESVDVETLSNVIYIAPHFSYKWSEKWHSQLGLTYAQLSSEPLSVAGGVDKDVGFEIDLTVKYRPYEGVQWINRVGVFAPGGAFKGGNANNFGTETIFGIETKAAITF